MAAFKAINVEYDDVSEVDIDDTKELQIEDALKFYQIALKHHSDGPSHYDDAQAAYKTLFDSEIFSYPESYNLLRRIELYGPLAEPEELLLEEQDELEIEGPIVTGDNAPSTLPQILHLAHKNYGDFLLKRLLLELSALDENVSRALAPDTAARDARLVDVGHAAHTALERFVDALDKDESDLDLWRSASLLARALGSQRASRFCLEAILQDGDDDSLLDLISLPSLAQSVAGQSLARLVADIPDQLSLVQSPLLQIKRKRLSKALRDSQAADPFSSLLHSHKEIAAAASALEAPNRNYRIGIVSSTTWADLADNIYSALVDDQKDKPKAQTPYCRIELDLGDISDPLPADDPKATSPSTVSPATNSPNPAWPSLQFVGDGGSVTSCQPVQELEMLSLFRTKSENIDSPAMSTRKRSSNAAELLDGTESGRFKSKRLRARESLVDMSVISTSASQPKALAQVEQDIEFMRLTDLESFRTIGIFTQAAGGEDLTPPEDLKHRISTETALSAPNLGPLLPCYDIFQFMSNFDRKVAKHMQLRGDDVFELDPSQTVLERTILGPNASHDVLSFPSLSEGAPMHELLRQAGGDCTAMSLSIMLLRHLLLTHLDEESLYMSKQWSAGLTSILHHVLSELDSAIYDAARRAVLVLAEEGESDLMAISNGLYSSIDELMELAQTILEFVFDHYSEAQALQSDDETSIIELQNEKARLDRWADLVQDIVRLKPRVRDVLTLRYIWTSTFYIALGDQVDRDHTLASLQELRAVFEASARAIVLPNNDALRKMSVEIIDREISRLTTAEFFRTVFEKGLSDPVTLIEKLEPFLELLHADVVARLQVGPEGDGPGHPCEAQPPGDDEIVKLLRKADVSIVLSLWKRLHDAYNEIEYRAMAANCTLRMIETVVVQLALPPYREADGTKRQLLLAKTIGQLSNLMKSLHTFTKSHEDSLIALDQKRIASFVTALVRILKITHAFDLFKDEVDLELRLEPSGHDSKAFTDSVFTFHNLELHSWILLLRFINETMAQDKESFMTPESSKMELIREIHKLVGMRGFCFGAGRAFIHYIKDELGSLSHVDGYELEFPQVLLDVHGLRCFADPAHEQLDHKSTLQAPLDRATAHQAVEIILRNAVDIKPADLYKHPIKSAIERVHSVVSRKKVSEGIQINRVKLAAFFRAPINPVDLYRCMSGHAHLYLAPALGPQHALATKGWYLLLGNAYMSKFTAQKRTPSGPTASDLDWAITYIRHDIEATGGPHWETWYRLAQAMDAKIENVLLWSAEKLNATGNFDIVGYERTAIHCYMMAVALSSQLEDVDFETSTKVAALYGDFACRMYASSRAPFDMQAYSVKDANKFLSTSTIIKVKAFQELSEFDAWRVAKRLFQQAIAGNPDKWLLHYMHGKVLWKMHTSKHDRLKPHCQQVLSAFKRAIELLPHQDRKDSKKEPILEPHYKIVSIVDKLYLRGELEFDEGKDILKNATSYARRVQDDDADWKDYILAVIRSVQHADKSNWHHRIMMRAAKIVYENNTVGAQRAKDELMQHMFTKTMTLQVWKPEHERPGRHFVYTARYTSFFVDLLNQLDDAANMEQLAKRTRRRGADYIDFLNVWTDIANKYVGLLRRLGNIPAGEEMLVFSMLGHADFAVVKEPLEQWCQDPANESSALSVLRDAFEFKKLNGNLLKPAAIDELIGDAYAVLFNQQGREILKSTQAAQQMADIKSTMSVTALMNVDPVDEKSASSGSDDDKVQPGTKRRAGIGRREIRSSAEACLSKTPAATSAATATSAAATAATTATASEPDKPRLRVVLPKRAPRRQSSSSASNAHQLPIDSDDDELSEVDEELLDKGREAVAQVVSGDARERSYGSPGPRDGMLGRGGEEDGDGAVEREMEVDMGVEFYDPFGDERRGSVGPDDPDDIRVDARFDDPYTYEEEAVGDADDEADGDVETSVIAPEEGVTMLVDDDEDDDDDEGEEAALPRTEVSSVTSQRGASSEDETMMGLVASDESDA